MSFTYEVARCKREVWFQMKDGLGLYDVKSTEGALPHLSCDKRGSNSQEI